LTWQRDGRLGMNRELNTKEEMLKRLAYVVYVGCLFFGFLFIIRGLVSERAEEVFASVLLGAVAFVLRQTGIRRWEFRRLAESFPLGKMEHPLSIAKQRQVEQLIEDFHKARGWSERQAIRQSLEGLVREEPVVADAYHRELSAVHPTLFRVTLPSRPSRK
jgi:hypothetical protein